MEADLDEGAREHPGYRNKDYVKAGRQGGDFRASTEARESSGK